LEAPKPETDLVGDWKSVKGTTTIELSITEESTFTWKVTESGKTAAELSGDLATNGDQIVLETVSQGTLGGSVKSLGVDEWVMIPPGVADEKAGLKFSRVK